jgi:hypothetical protein
VRANIKGGWLEEVAGHWVKHSCALKKLPGMEARVYNNFFKDTQRFVNEEERYDKLARAILFGI